MSLHAQKMNSTIADRENLSLRPGKGAVPKQRVARPVLSDLCRNVKTQPVNNASEKVGIAKMGPPAVTTKVQKPTKTTMTKTEITYKRQESVIATQTITSLKRQENDNRVGEEVSYSSKQLTGIIDADLKNKDDPFMVSEYVQDIVAYLQSLESDKEYKIRQGHMATHRSSPRMRSVLVNWMVDVHINFKFLLETLHLSIAVLDRYLQVDGKVGRENLQLVGVTAMIIACKYEEVFIPLIEDFVFICDNTFTRTQILEMEKQILCKLKFNIGRPLSLQFLRRFNKIACVNHEHHNLSKYMLEIFLLEYELCHIAPSMQAAAACCLALSILNEVSDPAKVWSKTLVYYSSYKYSDIKPVVINLAYHLAKMEKSKYQAVRVKYASSSHNKISLNPKLQGPLLRKLVNEAQALKKS